MTDKQKQAIQVLLRLTAQKNITDEEHILLLDFIVEGEKPVTISSQWWYDKNKRSYEPPVTVMYGCPVDTIITATDGIQAMEGKQ